jgi:hypothetical protein
VAAYGDKDTGYTPVSNPNPPATGYGTYTQEKLQEEIAYLESIRGGSTPGSVASWRIGEELSMAYLYLQPVPSNTGGGGGGGGGAPSNAVVKTATPDIVEFNNNYNNLNEVIADLLLENIGGQEILSVGRHDTVNGLDVSYQPIKNLKDLWQEFNPNTLIQLQRTSKEFFADFAFDLFDRIPTVGNGPNGKTVYLDNNGNLIIEFINIADNEEIEIQITADGTIYEAGL